MHHKLAMIRNFYELGAFFLDINKKSTPHNTHAGNVMKDKKTSKVTDMK